MHFFSIKIAQHTDILLVQALLPILFKATQHIRTATASAANAAPSSSLFNKTALRLPLSTLLL
jgi:hypothetical protein